MRILFYIAVLAGLGYNAFAKRRFDCVISTANEFRPNPGER